MSRTAESEWAGAAEAVFLTPRVVDGAAFEDLAGKLRALIERAAAEGRALEEASARAAGVLDRIGAEADRLDERLAATAARTEAIEQRLAGLEAAVAGARSVADLAAAVEARLTRLTTEAPARVEAETRLAVQLAQDRLRAVQDDAAARTMHMERVLEERGNATARRLAAAVGEIESRTRPTREAVEQSLEQLEARAAKLGDQIVRFTGPGLRALLAACDRAEALLARLEAAEGGGSAVSPTGEGRALPGEKKKRVSSKKGRRPSAG